MMSCMNIENSYRRREVHGKKGEVSVDNDIKEIARVIIEANEMAYNAYKPIVDDICQDHHW